MPNNQVNIKEVKVNYISHYRVDDKSTNNMKKPNFIKAKIRFLSKFKNQIKLLN